MDKDRKDNVEVFCGECKKKEGGQAKKFTVHKERCIPLCRKCSAEEIAKAKKVKKAANAYGDST